MVVLVTGTGIVVGLVGTLERLVPGRSDFACELWVGAVLPHAVTKRAIGTTPRVAWSGPLNRADVGLGGRVPWAGALPRR